MSEKNSNRLHASQHVSAPPSPHSRALEVLGARLAEAGLSESQLIAWLKQREVVPPGIFALQSIPMRRLEILLSKWEAIRVQLEP
jgi:hypothetical protein